MGFDDLSFYLVSMSLSFFNYFIITAKDLDIAFIPTPDKFRHTLFTF